MSGCTNRFAQLAGLLFIFVVGALAGPPPPLTITDSGYWITIVDESGNPSYLKIETVNDLRTGAKPPVTPDTPAPKPIDPPPAGISTDAGAWTLEINDPDTAQRYALMLETIRDGVIDEQVGVAYVSRAMKEAADEIVGENWDPFRKKLSAAITKRKQEGVFSKKKEIVDFLEFVRYGIAYASRFDDRLTDSEAVAVIVKTNRVIDQLPKPTTGVATDG